MSSIYIYLYIYIYIYPCLPTHTVGRDTPDPPIEEEATRQPQQKLDRTMSSPSKSQQSSDNKAISPRSSGTPDKKDGATASSAATTSASNSSSSVPNDGNAKNAPEGNSLFDDDGGGETLAPGTIRYSSNSSYVFLSYF